MVKSRVSGQTTISAKIFNTGTGEILATEPFEGKYPKDRQKYCHDQSIKKAAEYSGASRPPLKSQ
jgi:hypothetical protein